MWDYHRGLLSCGADQEAGSSASARLRFLVSCRTVFTDENERGTLSHDRCHLLCTFPECSPFSVAYSTVR
eukprot:scaffold67204_cov30-Tisochrysis_lutea.AAC.2